MGSEISLKSAFDNYKSYELTDAGRASLEDANGDFKVGITFLVLGLIGSAFLLGAATGMGNSTWSDLHFWKAMVLPLSSAITGLGAIAFGLYKMHAKLTPEQKAKLIKDKKEIEMREVKTSENTTSAKIIVV